MHIKIEIDCKAVSLRKHVARIIAKEVVNILLEEKQKWHKEEPIIHELENASIKRLVSCWIRLVWPGTKRHLSQYKQQSRQKGVKNGNQN